MELLKTYEAEICEKRNFRLNAKLIFNIKKSREQKKIWGKHKLQSCTKLGITGFAMECFTTHFWVVSCILVIKSKHFRDFL